ncbi:acetyl-CoA carboxylase biotin carboxyl carrier protein subunit [Bordetella petrii]|uniref:Acetyl-CoA carboxylase biotin carboxyl carrier protein subunit n=1 Tax=Bordetella petrii TaxID=94624 RepID=A0ABT7W6P3_9BORD|nr:acetyl-CoA carboxylase biotin carboxyl carrier protein subunit [Bordetella petrii]MDM9560866.1 acetyl-CoA carboxylase biotin carboxyl carrier protein subunit [Bordetella petrii]
MKSVLATVSGRVVQCVATESGRVQRGDEIVKIESMKMEIPVESEVDGRVARLLVKEGDEVQEGQVIAEIE